MTTMKHEEMEAELEAGAKLLRDATLARLAYDGLDGTPRVVPIGFLWTGEEIVLATHPSAPKYEALLARPRVALAIDTAAPARSLLLRGTAEIEVVDGVVP
jgi:nitroimidazol reductase NimA-like FMN-containing flavoprotein (pyridoxamine 5'-phosphate oxidase superfamily)